MNQSALDLLKVIAGPIAGILLAWAVGNRLSARWVWWQKRREQTQAAANDFYRLYGEFFATWKLWNYSLQQPEGAGWENRRWELLERAAAAEAGVEALLVKLASERVLNQSEMEAHGKFRQGFQTLRQMVRDRKRLDWGSSDYPQYASFKALASYTARLVSTVDQGKPPSLEDTQRALSIITSNVWEKTWHVAGSPDA